MADAHAAAHGHAQKHPYHLVDPSGWPIFGAMSAGLLAVGLVFYMHYETRWLLIAGVASVLFTMYGWWRRVVREAQYEGHHNPVVVIGLRYGVALFIASEVMFFAAFFWAFFSSALFPAGGVWPPEGIQTFNAFELPFLNTLVLLLSGVTVTWAHHALLHNDRAGLINGLACTVGLGAFFTALQAFEYSHAAFKFTDGIYPSTFFMATGFHGFHVMIGTIFLTVCLVRAIRGHFSPDHHFGFEAAAWYWHFVDVVWLFLFVAVYWWGG